MRRPFVWLGLVLFFALAGMVGYGLIDRGDASASTNAASPVASGAARVGAPTLVVLAPAEQREIVQAVEALGTARANESVTITAKVTETVRRVLFEDGQYADAGAVLVELTNAEETALLAEARATLDDAQRQFKRFEDLVAQGSAPMSQRDEAHARVQEAQARLQAIEARLGDRLIRAPFSGLLGFRQVSPGTLVTPSMEITTIDDVSLIKLDFAISESFIGVVRPGLDVVAEAAAWPGRKFEGKVVTVDSRVDPATRAVTVRAHLDNSDSALRPGMLLTVDLVTSRDQAIVIPESALLQIRDERFVYTVAGGRAQRIDVQIGRRRPGIVEIRSGLEAGTPVITEGVEQVRANGSVRVLEKRGPVEQARS